MKWYFPAKTFLLGEYAALAGGSAIIATTTPCFEIELVEGETQGIHPDSPAGQFWSANNRSSKNIVWHDPYKGLGGAGASSAQFLGAWQAWSYLMNRSFDSKEMLAAYYQYAWSREGLRPSGYDVIAQSLHQCVYINQQCNKTESFAWPFDDLAFLLLHSGQKLATHTHLQTMTMPNNTDLLSAITDKAIQAFRDKNKTQFIDVIEAFQEQLEEQHLTASHTLEKLRQLKRRPHVLAAKGCGALGADVLMLVMARDKIHSQSEQFKQEGWIVLGSSEALYKKSVENT